MLSSFQTVRTMYVFSSFCTARFGYVTIKLNQKKIISFDLRMYFPNKYDKIEILYCLFQVEYRV